jgi:hypothetical protein
VQSPDTIRRFYSIGFAVLSVGLIVLAIIPTETLQTFPTVCLFKNLFGVECFGCGMTRAVSSVLHGEFGEMINYNVLIIFFIPISIGFICSKYFGFTKLSRTFEQKEIQ